ncbi:hypothetical protein [Longimicrobium sp.]|uniref:hypothetical protein n=1 Tax=Longimicrobium sp. TaxID=2029185 RepID=UPI002E379307|nr:hypothetical protein [Longimicrobium sp.]HEX6038677.1 hypothetical protein [Longimicrobium sp.]
MYMGTGSGGPEGERAPLWARFTVRAPPFKAVRGTRYILRQNGEGSGKVRVEGPRGELVLRLVGGQSPGPVAFLDPAGRALYFSARRAGPAPPTMDLRRPDGLTAAIVHNALLSPVRDRWRIDLPGDKGMVAVGSVLQHEYTLWRGDRVIARTSKTGLGVRDACEVVVADGVDAPFVLAVVVVIDLLAHRTPDVSAGRAGTIP